MKIFLITFFSFVQLLATNPIIYSSLGDELYDNVEKIESLQSITKYRQYIEKITKYVKDIKSTKDLGLKIDTGVRKPEEGRVYLNQMRSLNKINAYFMRLVKNDFKLSMQTKDNELFQGILNSQLIDIEKNKKNILKYYKENSKSLLVFGELKRLLDEVYNSKRAKTLRKSSYKKSKERIQRDKMEKIKRNDIKRAEKLEDKLMYELKKKKKEIRQEQEAQLFN